MRKRSYIVPFIVTNNVVLCCDEQVVLQQLKPFTPIVLHEAINMLYLDLLTMRVCGEHELYPGERKTQMLN